MGKSCSGEDEDDEDDDGGGGEETLSFQVNVYIYYSYLRCNYLLSYI